MHPRLAVPILALLPLAATARPAVTTARATNSFQFDRVPPPATDDAAARARAEVIDGRPDSNSPAAAVLLDGRLPANEDQPAANFFFAAGTDGGRLLLDLGRALEVGSVASYSWHRAGRAPQVYTLYAATGDEQDFNPRPARPLNPAEAGWRQLATVDTRTDATNRGPRNARAPRGGQHAAILRDPDGRPLGRCRYLLFDIRRTGDGDAFDNTFFSEIDVTDAAAPEPQRFQPVVRNWSSPDGKFRYTFDLTAAPDLAAWVEGELLPVVREWYPRIVTLLASPGYTAPSAVRLEFRQDMGGTPAYTAGNRLALSVPFFRNQLQREAKGCVIHELVHVVQAYGRARPAGRRPSPTPTWLSEGIADYIRWFLFEPQAKGAEITRSSLARARYDASYRVSANFIDWVVRTHDKDLLAKLNAAAREGRYSERIWQEATGIPLPELGERWLAALRTRLGLDPAPPPAASPQPGS